MENTNCPLCSENNSILLWTKIDASYVKCTRCGLVYENPRLSFEELRKFYSDESYFVNLGGNSATSGYVDYFSQCTPALISEYFTITKKLARTTGSIRFLDIGCGPGDLVERARLDGWDSVGLEISDWAVHRAKERGLNVVKGTLREANFPTDSFDAISMFDVLEHLPNPHEYVAEARRVLKPKAVLVIETPNVEGFFAKYLYKEKSDLVKPRAHICLYSPKTVRKLFAACGFSSMKITTFPYCRKYTLGYFKSVFLSRVQRGVERRQLTFNESIRALAWK